jgi:hypothetical protein
MQFPKGQFLGSLLSLVYTHDLPPTINTLPVPIIFTNMTVIIPNKNVLLQSFLTNMDPWNVIYACT